jgi:hypothetical protein
MSISVSVQRSIDRRCGAELVTGNARAPQHGDSGRGSNHDSDDTQEGDQAS